MTGEKTAGTTEPRRDIVLTVVLQPIEAEALGQLVKRLLRNNLGRSGLNLADPHRPGDEQDMESALHVLRRTLADEGYDPR